MPNSVMVGKGKPVKRRPGAYAAFGKDDQRESVPAIFEERYGYRPEAVHDGGTIWLAGPLRGTVAQRSLVARAGAAQREMTPERARQMAMELGG